MSEAVDQARRLLAQGQQDRINADTKEPDMIAPMFYQGGDSYQSLTGEVNGANMVNNTANPVGSSVMTLADGGSRQTLDNTNAQPSPRKKKAAIVRQGILTIVPLSLRNASKLAILEQDDYGQNYFSFCDTPADKTALIQLNEYVGLPSYLFSTSEPAWTPLTIDGWTDVAYINSATPPDNIDQYRALFIPIQPVGVQRTWIDNITNQFLADGGSGIIRGYVDTTTLGGVAVIQWTLGGIPEYAYVGANLSPKPSVITTGLPSAGLLSETDAIYAKYVERNGNTSGINVIAGLYGVTTPKSYRTDITWSSTTSTTISTEQLGTGTALLHTNIENGAMYTPLGIVASQTNAGETKIISTDGTELNPVSYDTLNVPLPTYDFFTPVITRTSATEISWHSDWLRYADNPDYSSYANRKLAQALVDFEW